MRKKADEKTQVQVLEARGRRLASALVGLLSHARRALPGAWGLLTRARGPLITFTVMADCEGPGLLHHADLALRPNSFFP